MSQPSDEARSAAQDHMKRCSCGFLPLPDATHCPKCGKRIESAAQEPIKRAPRWNRQTPAQIIADSESTVGQGVRMEKGVDLVAVKLTLTADEASALLLLAENSADDG